MNENRKTPGVQVISRAAEILRHLGRSPEGQSLAQIARQVELPRSTVQRIIGALAIEGFVAPEKANGGFRLGPGIQSLANASRFGLTDRLRQAMRTISNETGETVDLAILRGSRMLFIDQVVGTHRLRAVSSIGETFTLTDTANGKAALACLERQEAADLIAAELGNPHSSSSRMAEILEDVEMVRSRGLAFDENEHTEGICAVGFALPDRNGDILALSVPVPHNRYFQVKGDLEVTLAIWKRKLGDPVPVIETRRTDRQDRFRSD